MEFESRPIQIPAFQEQVTHLYTNWPNFFQNFLKFEPILAQIWPNFEKSTHSYRGERG